MHHATSGRLRRRNRRRHGLARRLSQHHQGGGGVVHVAGRTAVQAAVALARVRVAGFRVPAAVIGLIRQILAAALGAGVAGLRVAADAVGGVAQ